jgi:hypothetical protein
MHIGHALLGCGSAIGAVVGWYILTGLVRFLTPERMNDGE